MLLPYVAVLVALIGLLLYVLSTNVKVQELGRILFFCGTLATLLVLPEGTRLHLP